MHLILVNDWPGDGEEYGAERSDPYDFQFRGTTKQNTRGDKRYITVVLDEFLATVTAPTIEAAFGELGRYRTCLQAFAALQASAAEWRLPLSRLRDAWALDVVVDPRSGVVNLLSRDQSPDALIITTAASLAHLADLFLVLLAMPTSDLTVHSYLV